MILATTAGVNIFIGCSETRSIYSTTLGTGSTILICFRSTCTLIKRRFGNFRNSALAWISLWDRSDAMFFEEIAHGLGDVEFDGFLNQASLYRARRLVYTRQVTVAQAAIFFAPLTFVDGKAELRA